MCLIPKAAAGSAADTRRMLIARRQPLQELKPGSISHPLFPALSSFDIVYNVATRKQVFRTLKET